MFAFMDTALPAQRLDSRPGPWAYRRHWLPELAALAALAALALWAFSGTGLDVRLAAQFFDVDTMKFTPSRELSFPWRQLYKGIGIPVVLLVVGSLTVLLRGLYSVRWCVYRRYALLVMMSLALGPGLVVNLVFKGYWGRPRPVHVQEFGGRWTYQDAVEPGTAGRGKSFPCGHSSAGYVLTLFWLVLKRRHRRLATAALLLALAYGTLAGFGRMMAGSHFASDVVWSALLVHLVNVVLYYLVFNMPGHEDAPSVFDTVPQISTAIAVGWGTLAVAIVIAALLATPYYADLHQDYEIGALEGSTNPAPSHLDVELGAAHVVMTAATGVTFEVRGEAEGFGLSGSRLRRHWEQLDDGEEFAQRYRIDVKGWFTDLDTEVFLAIPTSRVASLAVTMRGGSLSADHSLAGLPVKLTTGEASLDVPEPWRPGTP